MQQEQAVHIVDEQFATDQQHEHELEEEDLEVQTPDFYAEAGEPDWEQYGRRTAAFIKALLPELGKEAFLDDRREVHHYAQLDDLRIVDELDVDDTGDVDLAILFALPDESLLFVGADPTARDTAPLFGFLIEPFEPVPAPTSAQEALDLLRPGAVREAFEQGDEPDRQGEWWLLPTRKVPVGTRFTPGVNTRPYGPSPLGNHVPREWGMTVQDDEFMDGARARTELPETVTTPPEVVEWVHRQHQKVPTPESVLEWEDVQELAGEILVRGTLRHRENDHFVEDLGDDWHVSVTHNMDVYTADQFDRVVLD